MARRKRRSRRARNAKGLFVKKYRRNPRKRRSTKGKRRAAQGYVVGTRKIRRRKLNPRVRHRRRYRRNPMGLPSLGSITSQLTAAGIGAAGAIGLNVALSFIPLPDALKTGYVRHGVRLASALVLSMLAKKFLGAKPWINTATAGALTVIVYDIGKAVIQTASPEIGARLGEFEDVSLEGDLDGEEGFYDPASPLSAYLEGPSVDSNGNADDGMGAYMMEGNLDGLYA